MSFTRFKSGGGSFKRFTQPVKQYDTTALDNQIANATTRIQDAGYKPEDSDRRNWFEKLTNLPQGQNAFMDALELLGRPAQGVLNAIDKKDSMGSGEGFLRGISGKDRVRGSDLLENSNIKSPLAKTIIGTGLEIALDPVMYIPGAALSKVVTTPAKLTGRALQGTYKAAEKVIPKFGAVSETTLRPAAEKVKDSLGYMFKPDYKKTETLTGGTDDFLKNLERDTENSRVFMKENQMKNLTDTARLAGGIDTGVDVGRSMESGLTNSVFGPRRPYSDDQSIHEAANELMKSNEFIRNFALEKGIDIPSLSGYMTHVLSQEEKVRKSAGKSLKLDAGRFGEGNPNSKILNQRKLSGTAEDINDTTGRKFFEPNAFFATGVGQQRLIDYIHAVDFRRQVLSNPNFAQKYEKGMDIGKNVIVNSNNYKFLKDTDELADGINLTDKVGGDYVVTPQVKNLLDRYQKVTSDEGTKAFLKALDGLTGMWKKMALFSPGFHIRNVAGAMWNNYLAGMNVYQLGRYTTQAAKEVAKAMRGNESAMYKEFRAQGLGSGGYSQVEQGHLLREPDKAIRKLVDSKSKDTKGKVLQRVNPINAFQTSREIGTIADQTNRFALYKFSRDKGLTPKQAAEKVRESQFDYTQLTNFEQKARRVIPFYTWSRKNIPYQVQKFIEDPRKFQKINSLRLNAQENVGLDEENMPYWAKQNFWMPVSGSEGKGKMLSLNLPLGDLTKLSNPLKLASDSLTPLIKTPVELASNFNTFKQKPIEQFEGQTKQYRGGLDIPIKTAYGIEQLTGQIGRGLSNYFQKPENVDQDNKFRTPSMGINSILKDFDAEQNAYYERYSQLKKLQDLIKYIEQQEGAKPRTVNEIKRDR